MSKKHSMSRRSFMGRSAAGLTSGRLFVRSHRDAPEPRRLQTRPGAPRSDVIPRRRRPGQGRRPPHVEGAPTSATSTSSCGLAIRVLSDDRRDQHDDDHREGRRIRPVSGGRTFYAYTTASSRAHLPRRRYVADAARPRRRQRPPVITLGLPRFGAGLPDQAAPSEIRSTRRSSSSKP